MTTATMAAAIGTHMIHLPTAYLGFWSWLASHWPTAPHGCQWQYGRGPGQALHWVKTCHPTAALRRWPVLIRPAR